ncbi:MAG TPA: UDP-2,3-diacylglucosamine diphosphatase [Fibrobacteria bacterium]|nr:UDP-2,3-diacylglucosamine diphosphatase [Fibrobacteria bacterium]
MSGSPIAYFISDLHLGAGYRGLAPDRETLVLRFLREKACRAGHLFILGDLFEFWMEYRSFVPKDHFRVLAALEGLVRGGVEVHYLSGNHDFNLGSFFRDHLGLLVHDDEIRMDLQGKRLLMLHGDGLAASDWKYRIMKKVFRHPLSNRAFRLLHPDFGMGLAHAMSKASRDKHQNRPRRTEEYEAAARSILADGRQDILMHGHTHAAFVKELPEGIYVNSGEWLKRMEYVAMEGGACRVERFGEESLGTLPLGPGSGVGNRGSGAKTEKPTE